MLNCMRQRHLMPRVRNGQRSGISSVRTCSVNLRPISMSERTSRCCAGRSGNALGGKRGAKPSASSEPRLRRRWDGFRRGTPVEAMSVHSSRCRFPTISSTSFLRHSATDIWSGGCHAHSASARVGRSAGATALGLKIQADGVSCDGRRVPEMRKLQFFSVVAFGALVGLMTSVADDWSTQVVMMALGALFGAPIGGMLVVWGKDKQTKLDPNVPPFASSTSSRSLATNYWRDQGHPPFSKPSESRPDSHMLDPDRSV